MQTKMNVIRAWEIVRTLPFTREREKGTQQGGKFGQKGEEKENIGLDPDRGDKMFANDSTQKERNGICKKTQSESMR